MTSKLDDSVMGGLVLGAFSQCKREFEGSRSDGTLDCHDANKCTKLQVVSWENASRPIPKIIHGEDFDRTTTHQEGTIFCFLYPKVQIWWKMAQLRSQTLSFACK